MLIIFLLIKFIKSCPGADFLFCQLRPQPCFRLSVSIFRLWWKKKRGWFHEFQICCNCWSAIFKYVTDICHFQHTPISGQCQVSARWLECGIDMSIINSYVIQLALQRRKTSSVWTWTSQVRSLSNLCLRLLRFGNFP